MKMLAQQRAARLALTCSPGHPSALRAEPVAASAPSAPQAELQPAVPSSALQLRREAAEFVPSWLPKPEEQQSWPSIQPGSAAETERRVDPSDGNAYTRAEFVGCYGGTAEWDAAARPAEPAAPDGMEPTDEEMAWMEMCMQQQAISSSAGAGSSAGPADDEVSGDLNEQEEAWLEFQLKEQEAAS